MDEELTWVVRQEAGRPLKAYFYWKKKKNGQLVRSAEFTQSELEIEIERLIALGEDPTQFVRALKKLALSLRSDDADERRDRRLQVTVVLIAIFIALSLAGLLLFFPPGSR